MLLFFSLSGLTIAYSNSLSQGHYYNSTEPGVTFISIFFVLSHSVSQTSDHKKQMEIIIYLCF